MSDENLYAPPRAQLEVAVEQEVGAPATRTDRLKAVLVDALLALLLNGPVIWYYTQKTLDGGERGLPFTDLLVLNISGILSMLLLNGYYWSRYGQSIGKRLVGIKIVELSGKKPPLWRIVILRHWLISLFGLLPVAGKLLSFGDGLLIFRGDRRCIHDHLAGTMVVRAEK